jgi:hypothetical protein
MHNLLEKLKLPAEIIDIILEYYDYHRFRNGVYMRQLCLDDNKYNELKRKPMICLDERGIYNVSFSKVLPNKVIFYKISTDVYSTGIIWNMYITYDDGKTPCKKKNYSLCTWTYNDSKNENLTLCKWS